MHISFCVPCKNRLYQLMQTLPENLEKVAAAGADISAGIAADIVLVNYNSDDEMDAWVIEHCAAALAAGKLIYLKQPTEKYFHLCKARNIAHRVASGEFCVALDADNFIGDTIAPTIKIMQEYPESFLHYFKKYDDGSRWGHGQHGRIGCWRKDYFAIGGYDEKMLGMGYQDLDFLARMSRIRKKRYFSDYSHFPVRAIHNSIREKLRNSGISRSWKQINAYNSAISRANLDAHKFRVNSGGFAHDTILRFSFSKGNCGNWQEENLPEAVVLKPKPNQQPCLPKPQRLRQQRQRILSRR